MTRIPAELRDQRAFARAAQADPLRRTPPAGCSPACAARTCCSCSSRATAGWRSRTRRSPPASTGSSTTAPAGCDAAGFGSRSAFLTSPTFGGDQLAGALDAAVRALGRQPAALRRAGDQPTALTLSQAVRAGRLAHRQRRAGQHPRLAAGRVLRLRPALRLPQRRLPRARGSATRRCPTSTPSTRSTGSSSRRPHRAAGDGRDRPDHQPRARGRGRRTWSPRRPSGTGRCSTGCPSRRPPKTVIWRSPDAGPRGVRPVDRVLPVGARRRSSRHYGDDKTGAGVPRRPPAGHRSSPGPGAGHDVPVTVVAKDPAVLRRIAVWGWQPGLHPSPDAPVWRMDSFRDRFLSAFGR